MAIASGINSQLVYIKESVHGTTPGSPAMKILRSTSRNINPVIDGLETAELRTDRQVSDLRHGFNQVAGTVGFELSTGAADDMIEGAMSGTWTNKTTTATIVAAATGKTFTRSSGSFLTDGFCVGDVIRGKGFTGGGNNKTHTIAAVTATVITTVESNVVDEGSATRTIGLAGDVLTEADGKRISIGTALNTYTFERRFTDINQFQLFKGCTVNTLEMSIQPSAIVGGTLGLVGMSFPDTTQSTGASSTVVAPTASPMSSFDGAMYEGGTATAVVTGLDFSIDNGRMLEPVVGSSTSPDVFEGTARVSGTLTVFLENDSLLDKFTQETESSLWLRLEDPDWNSTTHVGNFINIVMPRIKFTGAEIDPPQQGPMPITMPFVALLDNTAGLPTASLTSLSIQRSNA